MNVSSFLECIAEDLESQLVIYSRCIEIYIYARRMAHESASEGSMKVEGIQNSKWMSIGPTRPIPDAPGPP